MPDNFDDKSQLKRLLIVYLVDESWGSFMYVRIMNSVYQCCSENVYIFLDLPTVDWNITSKNFNFPKKYKLPFYFVSASDGTNVVKVSMNL